MGAQLLAVEDAAEVEEVALVIHCRLIGSQTGCLVPVNCTKLLGSTVTFALSPSALKDPLYLSLSSRFDILLGVSGVVVCGVEDVEAKEVVTSALLADAVEAALVVLGDSAGVAGELSG